MRLKVSVRDAIRFQTTVFAHVFLFVFKDTYKKTILQQNFLCNKDSFVPQNQSFILFSTPTKLLHQNLAVRRYGGVPAIVP